jgi:hypothetical protein
MSFDDAALAPPPPREEWAQPPAGPGAQPQLDWRYTQPEYIVRRRFFELFSAAVDITTPDGGYVLHCRQKAFRLREDIRVFSDASRSVELLSIRARQIIDFGAAYDVTDSLTGEWVGTVRRKGWQSLLRDAWEFWDRSGAVIGVIQEDSMLLALLRRFLTNLVPQHYDMLDGAGQVFAEGDQFFNPFLYKLRLRFHSYLPHGRRIDPRLALAGALLLAVIEGRQQS